MAKKFNFEITNEVILNSDGLAVLEIKNDIGVNGIPTYDYYLFMPDFPLKESHGTLQENRHSTTEIITLYENGYFDDIIEEFV